MTREQVVERLADVLAGVDLMCVDTHNQFFGRPYTGSHQHCATIPDWTAMAEAVVAFYEELSGHDKAALNNRAGDAVESADAEVAQ